MVDVRNPDSSTGNVNAKRASTALLRLCLASSEEVCVYISPSIIPAAYSWSDGRIIITTGLLRIIDDNELEAVIAHELGHLLRNTPERTSYSLDGRQSQDEEQNADAFAIALLRYTNVPQDALTSVLTKVRDAPQTRPELREALTARIALLQRY